MHDREAGVEMIWLLLYPQIPFPKAHSFHTVLGDLPRVLGPLMEKEEA